MRDVPKEPFISTARSETIRKAIIAIIERDAYSAKEISAEIGIREKEVYEHLEHVRKSMGNPFIVIPSKCKKCNFIFEKRAKLKKPGKCPVCHNQSIEAPLFKIQKDH